MMPTYDNLDIMDFSRIWTGFDRQSPLANMEHYGGNEAPNEIDPMQLKASWRDVFPKMDLNDGYIGDGYPLCVDLPARVYLRRGARFRFLGYDEQSDALPLHT